MGVIGKLDTPCLGFECEIDTPSVGFACELDTLSIGFECESAFVNLTCIIVMTWLVLKKGPMPQLKHIFLPIP